jgi:primosomal protein N' (replication factor Y)
VKPLIRVALDVPLPQLFDYRCDHAAATVGARVLVPFGKRRMIGVIVECPERSDIGEERLKPAQRLLDREPLLDHDTLRLLRFAAEYYAHPLGAVVMTALPAALRRVRERDTQPRAWQLSPDGRGLTVAQLPPRARAQQRLLERLQHTAALANAEAAATPALRRALREFREAGWVIECEAADAAAPAANPADDIAALIVDAAPALNAEQSAAVAETVAALGRFQPLLLRGLTGSGKTEVYLHAAAAALARGLQVLMLVPEIALTPQLEMLVRARFPGTELATLHSNLAEGERARRWQAARAGRARIVLGTRLSVFVPLPQLGLIVVDEEHDSSFKQGKGFRYSARDLAVVCASQRGIPVLLGSATPSLESWRNATEGRYRLLELRGRIHAAPPRIDCIDLRQQKCEDGLSLPLLAALRDRLDAGEQSLVFINRRGYAPVLSCGSCGWLSDCPRCSARLVLHLREQRLRCHHCGHERAVPAACPDCGDADLAPLGQGTQRVEATLAQRFPKARILRIDRDSTRAQQAWPDMRDRIRQRDVDILVGTQILAKGHDFPHLNLVGILNADSLLYSSDFRAAERLYALLTQVAGRAGRGATRGQVMVQTQFPDHPLYRALQDQDFAAYAHAQLEERRSAGFPPYMHQALLRAEAVKLDVALDFLAEAAQAAEPHAAGITLYDPVPAGMMRRAGRERAQLLVQCASRARLREFLGHWRQALASRSTRARWSLDVDPLDF